MSQRISSIDFYVHYLILESLAGYDILCDYNIKL